MKMPHCSSFVVPAQGMGISQAVLESGKLKQMIKHIVIYREVPSYADGP